MILVEIYSKKDCHLCDVAKEVLAKVRTSIPFHLEEIMLTEGHELHENFKNDIPVVMINKEFAFKHRIPEKEFVNKLLRLEEGAK